MRNEGINGNGDLKSVRSNYLCFSISKRIAECQTAIRARDVPEDEADLFCFQYRHSKIGGGAENETLRGGLRLAKESYICSSRKYERRPFHESFKEEIFIHGKVKLEI